MKYVLKPVVNCCCVVTTASKSVTMAQYVKVNVGIQCCGSANVDLLRLKEHVVNHCLWIVALYVLWNREIAISKKL